MTARDRVVDMARIARKSLKGKTAAQRASWLRGYWLVAVNSQPEIKPHRELFFEEVSR